MSSSDLFALSWMVIEAMVRFSLHEIKIMQVLLYAQATIIAIPNNHTYCDSTVQYSTNHESIKLYDTLRSSYICQQCKID